MKVKRVDEQTIVDYLVNYGNLDKIYEFLQEEEINYVKKKQLTEDFYHTNEDWENESSQYLINNGYTVVSKDDDPYYPPTSLNNIFSNIKVDNLDVSGEDTTYSFNVKSLQYGYEKTGVTMYVVMTDDSSSIIYNSSFIVEDIGYLDFTNNTFDVVITGTAYFDVVIYQIYDGIIHKNIHKKEIKI